MAIAVLWESGDGLVTPIASGSFIGFYGDTFNSSIPLDNYNTSTFVTNRVGTTNAGILPTFTYTTPGYAIWHNPTRGESSGSIGSALDGSGESMTLHIQITSGSAVSLSSVNLFAYEGISITSAPTEVTVRGFESGSADWTIMGGQTAPLALTPHLTMSNTHDYYIGLSLSPTVKGASTYVSFALEANWY